MEYQQEYWPDKYTLSFAQRIKSLLTILMIFTSNTAIMQIKIITS